MLAVPRLLPCYSLKQYFSELFAYKKRQYYYCIHVHVQGMLFVFVFLHSILNLFHQIHSCVERTICHVCVFTLHCQRWQLLKFSLWFSAPHREKVETIYFLNGPFFFFFSNLKPNLLNGFWTFFPRHYWLITPFIVSSLHLCNTAALVAQWWPAPAEFADNVLGNHAGGSLASAAVRQPFEEGWKGGRHLPGCRKLPAVSPTGGWKQCLTSPPAASLR